jgi:pyridoxal phosphate-dependent aminotransferase EpsN
MDAPSQRYQKRILLSVPHMGSVELAYVQEAFATNWLSTVGPNLMMLEQAFSRLMGLPSVALGSGTAAIHLGLKLLDLKPGDEVITPTLTFAASCNPILYERGIPVFIDSERKSWNLDPQLLAEFLKKRAKVNKLPKAVTVVHLFGQSADLDSILQTCRHYELPLLEDAAESLGAQYKGRHPGTWGDIGVYSFNGNKIITCTGGGMLVSRRSEWVEKARYWSSQARDPDPYLYNYLHSEVGYNYRLSNVLAGIARGQLEVLELRVQQRRAVFERYRQGFAGIPGIEPQPDAAFGISNAESQMPHLAASFRLRGAMRETDASSQSVDAVSAQAGSILNPQPTSLHTRWLSCFLIDEKKFGMSQAGLIRFLDSANVEARPVWKPMHTQKLYQGFECIGGEVAEDLNRRGLCLPSSSSLSLADQQFVIDRIREAHFATGGRSRNF